MNEQQLKQAAFQHNVELLRADLQRVQDRAGTMVAVISTILGIGLPLIAQPQTRQYFHVLPFLLLLVSLMFFYLAFIRGTTAVTIKAANVPGANGQTRVVPIYDGYKPNLLERVISFQLTLPLKAPATIPSRLEKLILWRTAGSQWGHAFFVATLVLEFVEIVTRPLAHYNGLWHALLALAVVLFVKFVFLLRVRGEQTI